MQKISFATFGVSIDDFFLDTLVWATANKNILSVNEKLPTSKFRYFKKIYDTAIWILLRSCFRSTTSRFGEIKQLHKPWNYGASDARAFYFFCSFKNLKSSISEDNMPEYALDIFIENATKFVNFPLNAKNEDHTVR